MRRLPVDQVPVRLVAEDGVAQLGEDTLEFGVLLRGPADQLVLHPHTADTPVNLLVNQAGLRTRGRRTR
jgi:hypothetical protein